MIRLRIVEPSTPEWKQWRKDANEAAGELKRQLKATASFTVNEKLYRRMKEVYFRLYPMANAPTVNPGFGWTAGTSSTIFGPRMPSGMRIERRCLLARARNRTPVTIGWRMNGPICCRFVPSATTGRVPLLSTDGGFAARSPARRGKKREAGFHPSCFR